MCLRIEYINNKGLRLINMYERLNKGEVLSKTRLIEEYNINLKTLQRDINELRNYIASSQDSDSNDVVKYNRAIGGYYLSRFEREWLTNAEVLVICKILLESRALNKLELKSLLEKLIGQVTTIDRKKVKDLVDNEQLYYMPLDHNKSLINTIWDISGFIRNNEIISFKYTTKHNTKRNPTVKPVSIMFSEYYFYLISYLVDDTTYNPVVFRIDRMTDIKSKKEKFTIPYKYNFNSGEFRKKVHFMYSGKMKHVSFEFSGPSIEAVRDKLPTADITKKEDGVYIVRVESLGDGIDMWLKSQGDWIKMLDK